MADHYKKLTVIETFQEWRYKDAVATVEEVLEDVKKNKGTRSVVVCVEESSGYIRTYSSASENRLVLGSRLMFMGLSRMGYSPQKD